MPIASSSSILTIPRCMCVTRPSIVRCSSRPVERSTRNSRRICERDADAGTLGDDPREQVGYGAGWLTSQVPVEHWYDLVGNPTFGDAILGRLLNGRNRFFRGLYTILDAGALTEPKTILVKKTGEIKELPYPPVHNRIPGSGS